MKLFNFTSYLTPGTIGLVMFNDAGRVWAKGEASTRWHNGMAADCILFLQT
jgi:outer membrane translocation and assembly module TamA